MTYVGNKPMFFLLCLFLSFEASSQILADTLRLHMNEQNTIYVTTVLNHKDTLTLNFDTGCTDFITNEVLKNKLKDSIQLYKEDYPFQIGKSVYTTKVYDAELTGHGTEGRFGWNFFADKTVQLNYDKGIMVIHDQLPAIILNDNTYTKIPITWMAQLTFIEAFKKLLSVRYRLSAHHYARQRRIEKKRFSDR